ncbi:unnamed protein product, partial [Discosporangium mesarthrocarpum]
MPYPAMLPLAEDCVALLIGLLTELPRPPGPLSTKAALRREVVHRLATSECMHSEASSVMAGLDIEAAEEWLEETLAEVGERREPGGHPRASGGPIGEGEGGGGGRAGAVKFRLSEVAASEYDPVFFHLNKREHQAALETVSRMLKAARSRAGPGDKSAPGPLVGPPPSAHEDFVRVRMSLLFHPTVLRMVRVVLFYYATEAPCKSSELLLSRALQLITLQLHAL